MSLHLKVSVRNSPLAVPRSAEPPPAITVNGNVTVSPGSNAVLTCHVVSTVGFNLTWMRGGLDARLDPRVHVLTNLSLRVDGVTPDHSGWYECVAVNEGGVKAERVHLVVQGRECFGYKCMCRVSRRNTCVFFVFVMFGYLSSKTSAVGDHNSWQPLS